MTPVTIAQLRATSTVDLMTAARALGLGRTKAYDLARRRSFHAGSSASATPTVSLPRACASSSALLPTSRPNPCRQARLRAASLAMLSAFMLGPLVGHAACSCGRAAATRRSFVTQPLSVAAGPGEKGRGAVQETRCSSAQARRSGRSARRSRPDLPNSGRCPSAYSCTAWHIPSRVRWPR